MPAGHAQNSLPWNRLRAGADEILAVPGNAVIKGSPSQEEGKEKEGWEQSAGRWSAGFLLSNITQTHSRDKGIVM